MLEISIVRPPFAFHYINIIESKKIKDFTKTLKKAIKSFITFIIIFIYCQYKPAFSIVIITKYFIFQCIAVTIF